MYQSEVSLRVILSLCFSICDMALETYEWVWKSIEHETENTQAFNLVG